MWVVVWAMVAAPPEPQRRDPQEPSAPAPTHVGAQVPELDILREEILRRIMRAACVAGTLGLIAALLAPTEIDWVGFWAGAAAMVVVLIATFLPPRHGVLSRLYPWALVLVGGLLAHSGGPAPSPFLLVSGGLFIGSLVLSPRELVLLSLAVLMGGASAILAHPGPLSPEVRFGWTAATTSMISVVLPAAIAGRMLTQALAKNLRLQSTLLTRLEHERSALQETLVALEGTRQQLTHAQKLELIGQFAGGIAHDMNNALTAVLGEASLLPDNLTEERERIVEAGTHAAKLTRQLMMLGRKDLHHPRNTDLCAHLRDARTAIRRMIPSEIVVSCEVPNEPLVALVDPTELLQVLLNLAANARDAMQGDGELCLALSRSASRHQAVLEVSDTGSGMDPAVMARIFEPFFTTKGPGQGTGLGLANVQYLVQRMGAAISVESTPGRGTRFSITIPLTDATADASLTRRPASARLQGRVLIVDDDVRVRAVTFAALERLGLDVLEASSPKSAVDIARAPGAPLDLMVVDVVMPGGGGHEAIRLVRALHPHMKILVISGYNDDETLRRGIARGEYPFLAKPFSLEDLAAAVAPLLDQPHETPVTSPTEPNTRS